MVEHYNVMGPVKASFESSARYIAAELGPKRIRLHEISPGPFRTRAASGIDRSDALIERVAVQVPQHHLVDIVDVGALAAFLASDAARRITSPVIPVDGGQHLLLEGSISAVVPSALSTAAGQLMIHLLRTARRVKRQR
ncbi:SDR family oxidoreductase [Roseomonas chloroacetimidivorans]|uniref:SDR family oxidoreductase n=1 Tax=Roseomonas chloroacetimidivorans TaxID=1766656 RepID=UPI003C709099